MKTKMAPGYFYGQAVLELRSKPIPRPKERFGQCIHCHRQTGTWCQDCGNWVCDRRFTFGDMGCMGVHADQCKREV